MALSLKTLRNLFPKDEPAFKPPFRVETDKDGEVHIYDAGDDVVTTFCRYTQMPIDDDRALAAEVAYWEIEAGRLAAALNIAYPSPEKNVVGWRDMETAPKDGKHSIFAIKFGAFIYSIQGCWDSIGKKWINAADRDGEYLAWMPNVLLPDELCPWTDAFKARAVLTNTEGQPDAS